MNNEIMGMGAIVSKKVALGESLILFAMRSEPLNEVDSGWQFTEGGSDEFDSENPQIWLVSEILELERSLLHFINSPIGTKIARRSESDIWTSI
jgi:hypothetical protein